MYRYIKNLNLDSFSLIMVIFASTLKGVEIKRDIMRESEMDEKLISNIIEQDCKKINTWKDASLQNLHDLSPEVFRDVFFEIDKE